MKTPDSPIITTLTRTAGSIQAAIAFGLGASILSDLPEWVAFSLSVAAFLVGMVQAGLKSWAQHRAVDLQDVVEVRDGGYVVAGPANDQIGPGGHVRALGVTPTSSMEAEPQT